MPGKISAAVYVIHSYDMIFYVLRIIQQVCFFFPDYPEKSIPGMLEGSAPIRGSFSFFYFVLSLLLYGHVFHKLTFPLRYSVMRA